MPFLRIDASYQVPLVKQLGLLTKSSGTGFVTGTTLFFSVVMAMLFSVASRMSAAAMVSHAVALEDAEPRRRGRTSLLLLGVLVLGLLVCGAVHLYTGYSYSGTIDGAETPVSSWGHGLLDSANRDLLSYERGQFRVSNVNKPDQWHFGFGSLAFGIAFSAFLYLLCLRSPRWPLHPIGLLLVNTFFGNQAWLSILVGWLAKVIIVRYGGVQAFRLARRLFMGLIVGEVLAAAYWVIDPTIRVLLGLPYITVEFQPR
jgi:hypothetical protein